MSGMQKKIGDMEKQDKATTIEQKLSLMMERFERYWEKVMKDKHQTHD